MIIHSYALLRWTWKWVWQYYFGHETLLANEILGCLLMMWMKLWIKFASKIRHDPSRKRGRKRERTDLSNCLPFLVFRRDCRLHAWKKVLTSCMMILHGCVRDDYTQLCTIALDMKMSMTILLWTWNFASKWNFGMSFDDVNEIMNQVC